MVHEICESHNHRSKPASYHLCSVALYFTEIQNDNALNNHFYKLDFKNVHNYYTHGYAYEMQTSVKSLS